MAARRVTLYFTWDARWESARPLGALDNRYPAVFELRRFAWPHLEVLRKGDQSIGAFLTRVVLGDFDGFAAEVEQTTGARPVIAQRRAASEGAAEVTLTADLLAATDTLVVVSLDHFASEQRADARELAAVAGFLARPDACLFVCPHHNVGSAADGARGGTVDDATLLFEHAHHGDPLVPARQQIGGFARELLASLSLPLVHRWGLRPAMDAAGGPASIIVDTAADELGLLTGVRTFNSHEHLPHLQPAAGAGWRVLARQRIDLAAPRHPFVEAGNHALNAMLWAPPGGARRGQVFASDATLWSSAFGGLESLRALWRRVATLD